MGILDSFGVLAGSIIAALLMLVVAILSFFVTIFVVSAGASFGGYAPSGDFVALSAAVISGAAILAGATPLGAIAGTEE